MEIWKILLDITICISFPDQYFEIVINYINNMVGDICGKML